MQEQSLNESDPIISCVCDEPSGPIVRNVYPMSLSPQNIKKFWELSSQFRTLFGDEVNGNFKRFCEVLMTQEGDHVISNGLFWRMDEFVGVFYMTHIQAYDAQMHYAFFDRRHKGRINIARQMLKYVFDKYGFRRLSVEMPYSVIQSKPDRNNPSKVYRSGPFEFIRQVGLKEEGRRRKAALYDNEWFDVACMGILQEETQSWT